ncbi:hypothetical protein ACGF0J_21790 [Nonomuraea sp. NPDC047897]|uniref:hypothetical protein n=1 Tax=Nonomuraea sp. NPDC047897 TaxID=3364346 RepID=UPI003723DCDE
MSDPYGSDAGRLEAAIARWLTDRGVADPAEGAAELVLMARGHGWRPVEALRPPPAPTGRRSRPTARPEVAEALARCAAASERFRTTESDPARSS